MSRLQRRRTTVDAARNSDRGPDSGGAEYLRALSPARIQPCGRALGGALRQPDQVRQCPADWDDSRRGCVAATVQADICVCCPDRNDTDVFASTAALLADRRFCDGSNKTDQPETLAGDRR